MKRWIAIVMSFIPLIASAAGFWDGNAALQRGDSSFESGFFAVSDSFAPETVIEVENLETGKTARVTVSQGAPSQASILVLLSPKAADALGIAPGTVARVRVTLAARAPSDLASLDQDRLSNPDPEISPAVSQAAEQPAEEPAGAQPVSVEAAPAAVSPAQPAAVEPAPAPQPAPQPEPRPAPLPEGPGQMAPVIPESPVEIAAEPAPAEAAAAAPVEEPAGTAAAAPVEEPAGTAAAETAPVSEDERLLRELAGRDPQKQLFLPPREDEKFAYQQPVEPPQATTTAEAGTPLEPAPAVGPSPAPEIAATPEPGPGPAPELAAEAPAVQPGEAAQPRELPDVPLASEQSRETPLGIESVGAGVEPPLPEPETGLAHAEAPREAVPEISDVTAEAQPESLAVKRLPVPEAEALAQQPAQPTVPAVPVASTEPAAAAAEPPRPTAVAETKPQAPAAAEPIAALPPAAAPRVEPGPAAQPAAVQKAPPAKAERIPAPPPGTPYYVQLAAYQSESLATGLAASLAATYPVLVLAPATGSRQIYRVLVGPLNKAESGTLLRWFRNRGFPDAFVKQQ